MYSLLSNYVYIHRELWHHSKKPFLFQALEIVSQVLTGFFGILLPSGILFFLEQSRGFAGFALGTLVLFLLYAVVFVSHAFLQSRNAWQYTEFRTGFFMRRLLRHFMRMDYAVLTEQSTLQLVEKATDAVSSNWVGVEGMFRYDVTIFSSFLGLLLYAGLIGSVHPAIVLLLLALSVLQFLSYRRAASYEVRRRDDLSAIKLSQRYFQKQSYDTAAGKDVRLYQLGGWIDGVYRQINKRYQKILFHIRSAYFANDLLTLTLQLLRDGICYGFLIYRLAHGTMTVSGFVLALGAVSGFSSYFNEITSSLSKSVLCLEQIRWMREFLDLPLPAGLWEKIAGLPQKEETYLGKDMTDDGVTLSGGEMQKLMMARALYKNCRLLLLDEPTAALDAISENEMYETYSTLLKNKTALFISHRLASTRFCDTILFLENGKIKERGTHDELLALGGSYAHMFEVQSQYYQETEEHI